MGETLTTIVAIALGAILMFVFPLAAVSEMNDSEVLAMVQSYTTEFGNLVRTKGKITQEDLNSFKQKINATGNSYDVELEVHISDVNPGKKTENQNIGDTTYYVVYTSQIMEEMKANKVYLLKEGDYIVVYVKNTNTTISQMIKQMIYNITGDKVYVIFAQYSGAVATTGYN